MTAKGGAVSESHVASDLAIMADMRVRHEITAIPHTGNASTEPAADIERDAFSNDAALANLKPTIAKIVVADLTVTAQRSLWIDRGARADLRSARNAHMREQAHTFVKDNAAGNEAERADL